MTEKSGNLELDDDDLLLGAAAIAEYLRALGLAEIDEDKVYYWNRIRRLPLGKLPGGKELLGSKRKIKGTLQRAAKALA
jgi:hypothetical protein